MLRFKQLTFICAASLLAAILINFLIGSGVSLTSLFHGSDGNEILWDIRLPRLLTALGAGAAVSIAGVLSQALFRNALATPSVLGTEAGAAFGLAVCAFTFGIQADQYLVMVSTIAGAAVATSLALRFASGEQAMTRLLLGGFAMNAFLSAGSAIITSRLMESGEGLGIYHWLMGSFAARTGFEATLILGALLVGGAAAVKIGTMLDMLSLGDEGAKTLGVPVERLRLLTFILIAVLVGTSMSVGGALPFIGLIVPHFIRMQSGPQLRALILNSAIAGAALVLMADLAARTLRVPVEMDVGLLTTMIGAPYFLWLLKRETGA